MISVKIGWFTSWNTYDPKEMIDKIMDRALELQLDKIEDDMTVMVTKVNRLK